MTTPVWTELVCRSCSRSAPGRFSFNGRIEVRAMREKAATNGWRFKHNECFCSEDCLKDFERDEL